MSDNEWLMRIEGGLNAHFKQANGPSRPGVDWAVGLKRGDEVHTVMVRALLADDATAATRANQDYQARTAMQYLNDQLHSGWHPTQHKEHVIYISNPTGDGGGDSGPDMAAAPAKKPWWKLW